MEENRESSSLESSLLLLRDNEENIRLTSGPKGFLNTPHALRSEGNSQLRLRGPKSLIWLFLLSISLLFNVCTFLQSKIAIQNVVNNSASDVIEHSSFTGAFSRFPKSTELPEHYKRLTLISYWVHDDVKPWLRSFLNSVQYNADTVDLLFINRVIDPQRKCIDFEQAGIDITWGRNIKHVCIDENEWEQRLVTFLCDQTYGWGCTDRERVMVKKEISQREDYLGYEWKLFRGAIFRDLFLTPQNPFWAWIDVDTVLGDMRHFPFSLLSKLSFLVLDHDTVDDAVLFGQLTAWNLEDETLMSIWKKIPTLRTARALKRHRQTNEEQGWSYFYMNVDDDFPGKELSYAQIADGQSDDFLFNMSENANTTSTTQLIFSGRDVLFTREAMDRQAIEELIKIERDVTVSEKGWYQWSKGYDGSDLMLLDPKLNQNEAYTRTLGPHGNPNQFRGELESIRYWHGENCPYGRWINPQWRTCYPHALLTDYMRWNTFVRSSFVHFKEQVAGYLFQRREIDVRPRNYSRYLLKHSLRSKKTKWGAMPPLDITKDHVMVQVRGMTQVWKMGPDRDKTLYEVREIV